MVISLLSNTPSVEIGSPEAVFPGLYLNFFTGISNDISKKIASIALAISAVTFLSLFIWTQPIFKLSILFIWAIFSIILTFSLPQKSLLMRLFKAFLMSIILIAFLTLSKQLGIFTKSLGPSLSFHLYHILIATWVILVNYTISA